MSFSIQVLGLESAKVFLKTKGKEALALANAAVMKAGFYVQGEVQQSIAGQRAEPRSVDTGRFLNSVRVVQNTPLSATIESNVEYAKFLEYGTSRMPARSHFRNSSKRNEKKVREFIVIELKKIE
ncbi:MAG: HK97-gp10 family putative phage morphogenesis protein [Candidatus Thorarchaeota archaeon]